MAAMLAPEGATSSTAVPPARNLAQVVTTKLLRTPGIDLAKALGKDESVVSRLKSGERAVNVQEFLAVMDFLGYKFVSKGKECVPADELRVLRRHYAATHGVDPFSEDPE